MYSLTGRSGQIHYHFEIFDMHAVQWRTVPGVYAFVGTPSLKGAPIPYIGKTENFATRMRNHERWEEARLYGAKLVLAAVVYDAQQREQMEIDLIQHYRPILNEKYKGAEIPDWTMRMFLARALSRQAALRGGNF